MSALVPHRWWSGTISPLLVVAAAAGAALLAVVVATSWPGFGDEHAYWLAANRLASGNSPYSLGATVGTPFAYWYPPFLAQALAPITLILPGWAFSVAWTVLLLGCLWFLSGRNLLVALACIAFLPVALELRIRNVHLLIAVLMVLAIQRSWVFWIPAALIKVAPILGVLYLIGAGRRRDALLVCVTVAVLALISIAVSPGAWRDFIAIAAANAGSSGASIIPVPYAVRLALGATLALVSGRRGDRVGEVGVVVAITIANPTLWGNAFALLLAALPLSGLVSGRVDSKEAPTEVATT